jgi:hypothetical protein
MTIREQLIKLLWRLQVGTHHQSRDGGSIFVAEHSAQVDLGLGIEEFYDIIDKLSEEHIITLHDGNSGTNDPVFYRMNSPVEIAKLRCG